MAGIDQKLAKVRGSLEPRFFSLGHKLLSLRIGHQLGLFITGHSLRLSLIRRFLNRSRVVDVASFAMDPENTGSWSDIVETAAAVLAGYIKDRRLGRIPINIGLLGEDTAFRRLYLPRMSASELASAIKWEGARLFPFDLEQCSVYNRVIGQPASDSSDPVAVNIIAFKNAVIETIYERFAAAGLEVGQIGFLPDFMAPVRRTTNSGASKRELVLYLDDEQSMAIFVQDGNLDFFQQFVTPLQVQPDSQSSLSNLDAVTAELISFIDLYNGQSSGNAVQSIFVAGKYAEDKKNIDLITKNTGLPCQALSNDSALPRLIGQASREQMATHLDAIMTAMADPDSHPLAPKSIQVREANGRLVYRLVTVGVLAVLAVVNMQLLMGRREQIRKNELDTKRTVAQSIEHSPGYQGYISLMGKLKREQAYLNHSRDRHDSHFHILLKELSLLAPDHVSLTEVDLTDEDGKFYIRLDGHVRVAGFSPEIILAAYVESLGKSPFFENVKVSDHNKKNGSDGFDLTFRLKMDARV